MFGQKLELLIRERGAENVTYLMGLNLSPEGLRRNKTQVIPESPRSAKTNDRAIKSELLTWAASLHGPSSRYFAIKK